MAYQPQMTTEDFHNFQQLILNTSGISLKDQKKTLVKSRLLKRIQQLNLNSFSDYFKFVTEQDREQRELTNMINRITTNETYFFRNEKQFDFLKDTLFPKIKKGMAQKKKKKIRIWSAGCSSGEEPYSIAITILENFEHLKMWDIKILATDLDTDILRRAQRGIYSDNHIKLVQHKSHYFRKVSENGKSSFQILPQVKRLVLFKQHNLVRRHFPYQNYMDIVFCRNVIIYFGQTDRQKAIDVLTAALKPGGYLFLGHSETLIRHPELQSDKNSIFRKVKNA